MPPFQLNILNAFLTYPQVGQSTRDALYTFLTTTFDLSYICVSEELHADGNKHFHAFLKFKKRFRSNRESVFDFDGNHPNIQSAYNPGKCLEYVKKDGNFIEDGEPPAIADKKRTWDSVVDCATKEEFMLAIQTTFPRDYVLNLERIEYFADKKFKPENPVYTPTFSDFIVPERLQEWVSQMTEVSVPAAPSFH